MTEWQSGCSLTCRHDFTLMAFACVLSVCVAKMRGSGRLCLTQEAALSLLMHWSTGESVRECLTVSEIKSELM